MEVLFKERYGTNTPETVYIRPKDQEGVVCLQPHSTHLHMLRDVKQFFRSVFLPQGYPESVSSDYLNYQVWDTIQAFASSITGTLATEAVLKGMGVGDESATSLAATITWLLKDGTGMLGKIIFAWWKGSYLDCDCKQWRLVADFLNDVAMCLELLAPHFHTYFTPIICISSISKAIVGVTGGSTRAALTQHQARRDNMAEVSAKDGSQETLVNLTALLTSLLLLPMVSGKLVVTWVLFLFFTLLHLAANYMAVRSIRMETLNRLRLRTVLQRFLQDSEVPTVEEANKMESVILGRGFSDTQLCGHRVILGSSLQAAMNSRHPDLNALRLMVGQKWFRKYLLWPSIRRGKREIHVILHSLATSEDQILAYFHAVVLGWALVPSQFKGKKSVIGAELRVKLHSCDSMDPFPDIFQCVEEIVDWKTPQLLLELKKKGFVTSHTLLAPDEWRAKWSDLGVADVLDTHLMLSTSSI